MRVMEETEGIAVLAMADAQRKGGSLSNDFFLSGFCQDLSGLNYLEFTLFYHIL